MKIFVIWIYLVLLSCIWLGTSFVSLLSKSSKVASPNFYQWWHHKSLRHSKSYFPSLPCSFRKAKRIFSLNFDEDSIPQHIYTPLNPLEGEIMEVRQLTRSDPLAETYHIVINHFGKFPYIEGQNVGIIPPGDEYQAFLGHNRSLL